MAERRRAGAHLLRHTKLSKAAIARWLAVTRSAVGQWAKDLAAGGLRQLAAHVSTGRPGKLSADPLQEWDQILRRGALAAGFPTDRWTAARVKEMIERVLGVTYHVKYIPRLLTRSGWSLQQPLARAAERDEEVIQAWLAHDWPRIKKGAATGRGHRVFRCIRHLVLGAAAPDLGTLWRAPRDPSRDQAAAQCDHGRGADPVGAHL